MRQYLWGFLFLLVYTNTHAGWDRETYSSHLQLASTLEQTLVATAELTNSQEYGTAFFVGVYQGEYLMATNYHMMPDQSSCSGSTLEFKAMGTHTSCKKLLGSWKNIEFALFTVDAVKSLAGHELKFDFDHDISQGMKLFMAGYGHFQNPYEKITFDRSNSCQTLSDNNYTFVSANENYGAYSFKHGCQASGGDSGSALVNANAGTVVGIHWAITNFQGNKNISGYKGGVDNLGVGDNFGVPAVLIKKIILESGNSNKIIQDLLSH